MSWAEGAMLLPQVTAIDYVELFLHKTVPNNEKTALVKLQLQVNLLLAWNAISQKQLVPKKSWFAFNPSFDSVLWKTGVGEDHGKLRILFLAVRRLKIVLGCMDDA